MHGSDIESAFFGHFSDDSCRRILRSVFLSRRLAFDACRDHFDGEEAENMRTTFARAKLEGFLRDTAEVIDAASATVHKAPGSRWFYRKLRIGNVVMTAASVETPCAPVYKAEFRKGLASSGQASLFDKDESGIVAGDLYALLLHTPYHQEVIGGQEQFKYLPGSTYIAFPAFDLDGYSHEINLFDRYPDIVAGNYPPEWKEHDIALYKRNARRSSWPKAS